MCDYSLFTFQNRLAVEGETLVLRRFPGGTAGFISAEQSEMSPLDYCAVCVPPGARLRLTIPEAWWSPDFDALRSVYCDYDANQTWHARWQTTHSLSHLKPASGQIDVTFAQFSGNVNVHRDGVVFADGSRLLLQGLMSHTKAVVLSMAPHETEPEPEPMPVPELRAPVAVGV